MTLRARVALLVAVVVAVVVASVGISAVRAARAELTEEVDEDLLGRLPVLEEVMEGGHRTRPATNLEEVRTRFQDDFAALDDRFKVLNNPPRYPVSVSGRLERLSAEVREEALGVNVSDSD